MENKQTAVEWLEEQFMKGTTILPILFQQAKQMEKEQIIDAANQKIFGTILFEGSDEVITKGENYYNMTYGKSETKR